MGYVKQNFTDGQTLTAAMLNKIESGIAQHDSELANKQPKGDYYTKEQTDKAIEDAVSAIDIPETDLSDYLTKTEAGQTYQPKGDYQPAGDYLTEHQPLKTINGQSLIGEGDFKIGAMTKEIGTALLDCLSHVAWVDENGQNYYDVLNNLLFPPKKVVSLSAVFDQGNNVIYDDASLNNLKQYLTVTATYEDESTEIVTNYLLHGALTAGNNVVTVTFGEQSTTVMVTVTAKPEVVRIEAVYTQGDTSVYDDTDINSLKDNLVVNEVYTNNAKLALEADSYSLSGSLAVGESTITVTYKNFTDTFKVNVTNPSDVLFSIRNYEMDGTEPVHTGLKLLETDVDFSLCIDIDITQNGTSGLGSAFRLFASMDQNNGEGSNYGINSGLGSAAGTSIVARYYDPYVTLGSFAKGAGRIRYVFTHEAGSGAFTVYHKLRDAATMGTISGKDANWFSHSEELTIGTKYDWDSAGDRIPVGIIHKARVYNRVLSSTEASKFIG